MTRGRLAAQDGFTMITSLFVLTTIVVLAGISLTVALNALTGATGTREGERAQAAADAGLDLAQLRMNKVLLSSGVPQLAGLGNQVLAEVGCTSVAAAADAAGASAVSLVSLGNGATCPETAQEAVDEATTFAYVLGKGVRLNVGGGGVPALWERQVVVVGRHTPSGTTRRVMGTFRTDINATPRLFKLHRYVRCSSRVPTSGDPRQGCPGA